jgi:hypothetical protein
MGLQKEAYDAIPLAAILTRAGVVMNWTLMNKRAV